MTLRPINPVAKNAKMNNRTKYAINNDMTMAQVAGFDDGFGFHDDDDDDVSGSGSGSYSDDHDDDDDGSYQDDEGGDRARMNQRYLIPDNNGAEDEEEEDDGGSYYSNEGSGSYSSEGSGGGGGLAAAPAPKAAAPKANAAADDDDDEDSFTGSHSGGSGPPEDDLTGSGDDDDDDDDDDDGAMHHFGDDDVPSGDGPFFGAAKSFANATPSVKNKRGEDPPKDLSKNATSNFPAFGGGGDESDFGFGASSSAKKKKGFSAFGEADAGFGAADSGFGVAASGFGTPAPQDDDDGSDSHSESISHSGAGYDDGAFFSRDDEDDNHIAAAASSNNDDFFDDSSDMFSGDAPSNPPVPAAASSNSKRAAPTPPAKARPPPTQLSDDEDDSRSEDEHDDPSHSDADDHSKSHSEDDNSKSHPQSADDRSHSDYGSQSDNDRSHSDEGSMSNNDHDDDRGQPKKSPAPPAAAAAPSRAAPPRRRSESRSSHHSHDDDDDDDNDNDQSHSGSHSGDDGSMYNSDDDHNKKPQNNKSPAAPSATPPSADDLSYASDDRSHSSHGHDNEDRSASESGFDRDEDDDKSHSHGPSDNDSENSNEDPPPKQTGGSPARTRSGFGFGDNAAGVAGFGNAAADDAFGGGFDQAAADVAADTGFGAFGEPPPPGRAVDANAGFGAGTGAFGDGGGDADAFGSATGFGGEGFGQSSGFGTDFAADGGNGFDAPAKERRDSFTAKERRDSITAKERRDSITAKERRDAMKSAQTSSTSNKSAAAASLTTGKSTSSKSAGNKNNKTVVTKKPESAPAPPPPKTKPAKQQYKGGYTREQMTTLAQDILEPDNESVAGESKSSGKRRPRKAKKTGPLVDFAVKVNATIVKLGIEPKADDTDCRKLILGFETLVGMLLQHSDELELQSTFARQKDAGGVDAFTNLLDYAPALDETYTLLTSVLEHYAVEDADEEMNDFLYGMNLTVELLCEVAHRVAAKQAWNARACTAWATLLELLARDTLEVTSIFGDKDTPEFEVSGDLEDAWTLTGHDEEFATLQNATDLTVFRHICYEVILSTDQWCPDTDTLMDICGIDETMLDEGSIKPSPSDLRVLPPETAVQVLEKITGDPLPRKVTLAQILRRIIPGQAISDPELHDNFVNIRSEDRNRLGIPTSNLVAISSVPEDNADPDSLGVAGVGKTTLAAMIANHEDVRRHFNDGIAWVHLGQNELNYIRYVQCMRDLIAQLEVEEGLEPLFPELLHAPGESASTRRRREEGFMVFVRETMIDFLHDRKVLVVLDDVCFEPDLDWFDFGSPPPEGENQEPTCCVVLLTTRRRNLLPAADTVEVDMLEEDEAVDLLIRESGKLSDNLMKESNETKAVVRECAFHPLAVKSVGRWLNLKHATAGVVSSVEEIHDDVMQSMERILKSGSDEDADMMYEIMNMSLSPAINEEPTAIIKFCFAAFVRVFCDRNYISDFALSDSSPVVPQGTVQLLFEALLDLEEETLLEEGSLFYAQKKDAGVLIPEALTALGVLKVILTVSDAPEDEEGNSEPIEEKFLQITHQVQQEYGEYLLEEDSSIKELTEGAERQWNRTFAQAYLAQNLEWDSDAADAELDYALEMMPAHMVRGGLYTEAANLLSDESFVDGRLLALGRENGTRRHIKDCELLYDALVKQKSSKRKKMDPKAVIKQAYQTLGGLLTMDEDDLIAEEGSPEAVEVGRCHFEIGFSLAEKRCWDAAIAHWETSQELLVTALGMVEVVAGVLFNVGVVYADMNEYEQALGSLKQCLRIRGAIHGEEHILYAQTIQKIGDIFLAMSDYHEAMESYNWALDVMHIEPSHHRIDIGDILENLGSIHYSKGQVEESLQCYQDALRSKQTDLGEDHPELSSIFQHIGNCLSDQSKTEEAVTHFEEAIRLKKLDPDGGDEGRSDVLTIKGVLSNLKGRQKEGLECYEKALQILVTKVPHKKEKVASLLHLIGCVYLMSGEHKKAMKLFEESLQARRKVLGFVHLDVASTLFNMAFLHQTRNRLDKALKCLEEALKIRQLRLPDSEKVAVTHEKIGTLARSIGKTKKAEIAFAEALRIRKLIHGDSHEAVATVLQEMGDLMDNLGEYDEAMKKYGEALSIRHNRLGPDDLAVAETLYSMGFTLQNNGAAEKALECFDESLSIRKFQLGDDAKECGDTLNMMGFVQAKRGELDEALSLLWDALRIRKLQEDNIKISETLKNIGNVHREKEEYELAIECYEECLKIRKAELGDEHEKVADAYVAIGNVQSDMEKRKSAMSSYQEALQIRRRLFGPQDESVAAVLQYMGTLEFHAKRLDRALQLLNDFINIREGLNTERDGDYVNVLFMIGNIHKMEGDEEQAQSCWTEAYRVFKELGLEDVNPEIAKVMGDMVGNNEVSTTQNRDSNQDQGEMFQEEPPSRSKKGGGLLGKLKRTVKKRAKISGGGHSISGGASVVGGGGIDGASVADESVVAVEKKRLGMRRKRDKGKGHQL